MLQATFLSLSWQEQLGTQRQLCQVFAPVGLCLIVSDLRLVDWQVLGSCHVMQASAPDSWTGRVTCTARCVWPGSSLNVYAETLAGHA